MKVVSNRSLAMLVVGVMCFSVLMSMLIMNSLPRQVPVKVTARATTDSGNVTIRVETSLSILLNQDTVNFGAGYVNDSNALCAANATLTAGAGYTDRDDCWTNNTAQPGPLLLENDGNVNVSLTVKGPDSDTFFLGYNPGAMTDQLLQWKFRNNETDACTENVTAALSWQNFSQVGDSICDNLRFTPEGQDELAIDVMVVIPATIPSGQTYENASIEFTAAAS
ncbi:MAG: hypothetical protein HGA85_03240 [Nanoarchaeota archaeon]|nr:hypothetical protein [Nanoarchaeota archaeon]